MLDVSSCHVARTASMHRKVAVTMHTNRQSGILCPHALHLLSSWCPWQIEPVPKAAVPEPVAAEDAVPSYSPEFIRRRLVVFFGIVIG